MHQKIVSKFNILSFNIVLGLCAIIPFIFLPTVAGGSAMVKGFVLYTGVFLAVALWLIAQFIEGSFKIPKSSAFLALGSWVLLSLVGALISKNVSTSLWGSGFVFDSFATTLVLSLFVFMIASFAKEQRHLVKIFLATFVGSAFTVLLQIILYLTQKVPFIANNLSHVANQGTLVGSWVDFTYFVTIVFILSLLMYEVLVPKGFFRLLSLFSMIVSLISLVFLNFKTAWIITIASSLVIFVYKSSVERVLLAQKIDEVPDQQEKKQRFPFMSLIALLIGLFFFLSSSSIGSFLSQSAGISFNDIRPSFSTTTKVMRSSLYKDPLFGPGAGSYADVWNLNHSKDINKTAFWNTSFESGFNTIGSLATTNGILPTLTLIAFLIISLIHGFKLFNYKFNDRFTRFIGITSFIINIVLVMLVVFASPGIVLISFGFVYIGLLFGVSSLLGKTETISVDYLKDPRTSFFMILSLVVLIMAGFSAIYFSANKFASIIFYNKALSSRDLESAEKNLNKAINLSSNDTYWKTRTMLYADQFKLLASKENPDKAQLQLVFTKAEQSAQSAIAINNQSSSSWLNLSQVYQLVGDTTNVEAIKNASDAGGEAQRLSPNNPLFAINNARIELIKKDTPLALSFIEKALEMKPDYLDAFIFKGQIGQSQGDQNSLKNELIKYVSISPYDEQGHVLLGNSYVNIKDYQSALNSFARAKQLNPNNSNTYLLYIGTLEISGEKNKAIEELEIFKVKFPNIQGVEDQIKRIKNIKSTDITTETPEIKN